MPGTQTLYIETPDGTFHRVFIADGTTFSGEQCNLDDSGTRIEHDSIPEWVEREQKCGHCLADQRGVAT